MEISSQLRYALKERFGDMPGLNRARGDDRSRLADYDPDAGTARIAYYDHWGKVQHAFDYVVLDEGVGVVACREQHFEGDHLQDILVDFRRGGLVTSYRAFYDRMFSGWDKPFFTTVEVTYKSNFREVELASAERVNIASRRPVALKDSEAGEEPDVDGVKIGWTRVRVAMGASDDLIEYYEKLAREGSHPLSQGLEFKINPDGKILMARGGQSFQSSERNGYGDAFLWKQFFPESVKPYSFNVAKMGGELVFRRICEDCGGIWDFTIPATIEPTALVEKMKGDKWMDLQREFPVNLTTERESVISCSKVVI